MSVLILRGWLLTTIPQRNTVRASRNWSTFVSNLRSQNQVPRALKLDLNDSH
jgi:hypothetical protein